METYPTIVCVKGEKKQKESPAVAILVVATVVLRQKIVVVRCNINII